MLMMIATRSDNKTHLNIGCTQICSHKTPWWSWWSRGGASTRMSGSAWRPAGSGCWVHRPSPSRGWCGRKLRMPPCQSTYKLEVGGGMSTRLKSKHMQSTFQQSSQLLVKLSTIRILSQLVYWTNSSTELIHLHRSQGQSRRGFHHIMGSWRVDCKRFDFRRVEIVPVKLENSRINTKVH